MPLTLQELRELHQFQETEGSIASHYQLLLPKKNITDDEIPIICDFLKEKPEIIKLDLSNNHITEKGAKTLLTSSRGLRGLELYNNNIGNAGAAALAEHQTLLFLDLSNNNIGDDGAIALARHAKKIDSLILSCNKIKNDGAIALANNKTNLKKLNLDKNQIEGAGIQALKESQILKNEKNHISFRYQSNDSRFTEENIQDLIKDDLKGPALSLSYLGITDKEVEVIYNCIDKNPQIKCLCLDGNNITEEGAKTLAKNESLNVLSLSNNLIGDAGAQALAKNKKWDHLNLNKNLIGNAGATALAQNKNLEILELSYNYIEDDGAVAFQQYDGKLKCLDLEYNKIGKEGMAALALVKSSIRELYTDHQNPSSKSNAPSHVPSSGEQLNKGKSTKILSKSNASSHVPSSGEQLNKGKSTKILSKSNASSHESSFNGALIREELKKAIQVGIKATTSLTKKKIGAFLLNELEGAEKDLNSSSFEDILYAIERAFSHSRNNLLRRDWVKKMPDSYRAAFPHLEKAREQLKSTKGKTLLEINQVIKDAGNKEYKKNYYNTYKFFQQSLEKFTLVEIQNKAKVKGIKIKPSAT